MKTTLLACVLVLATALDSNADLYVPHQMDWFTATSEDVVLCEEQKIEIKKIAHHPPESSQDWTEIRTEVTCKVLRVFKGGLQPGAIMQVDYDMIFKRSFGLDFLQAEPKLLPPGRALLFLTKGPDKATYDVVTAKLIQQSRVYQFVQLMDPGPLSLGAQRPENFKPATPYKEDEPESEDDLIKDELVAMQKSASIKP